MLQGESNWCMFFSSDILVRDKMATMEIDEGMSGEKNEEMNSDNEDDAKNNLEKSDKLKYTPYKFSGKSYQFDFA